MAVLHFDHNRPRSCFSGKEVINTGKGRSIVCGAFLGVLQSKLPVIIQMEAGCWRGCCMIGEVFEDVQKPGFQEVGLHLGRQR